jgi:hypothetical protein
MASCSACGHELAVEARFCGACGTPRAAPPPAFQRAEEEFARLRAQYGAGALSAEQFSAAVEAQLVEHDGATWMLGVSSGKWFRHDGIQWRQTEPPAASVAAPPNLAAPSTAPPAAAPQPAAPWANPAQGMPRPAATRRRLALILAAVGLALIVAVAAVVGAFWYLRSGGGSRLSGLWANAGRDPLVGRLLASPPPEGTLAGWRLHSQYADEEGERSEGEAGTVMASLAGEGGAADLQVTVFADAAQAQHDYGEITAELVGAQWAGATMVTLPGQTGWCTGNAERVASCRALVERAHVFVLFRQPVPTEQATAVTRALSAHVAGLE